MIVTLDILRKHGACKEGREQFFNMFGLSVEITRKVCMEYGKKFNLDWISLVLFSSKVYDTYEEKRKKLLDKFSTEWNKADREKEYNEFYSDIYKELREKYDRRMVLVFWECVQMEEKGGDK